MISAHGIIHNRVTAVPAWHDYENTEVVVISSAWRNGHVTGSQTINVSLRHADELYVQLGELLAARRAG